MTISEDKSQGLLQHISAIKNTSVLVVGDIMLDRFVYGSVERISPESPVPVLSINRENMMLGGAGNALANLSGLGVKAQILSIVGDDEEGTYIRDIVQKLDLDADGLLVDPNRPTIVKTRFLAGHQQLLRTDFERKEAVSKSLANEMLKKAQDLIKKTHAVILSDYGKGLLSSKVITDLIGIARKNDVPVIVDPKGQDFSIYRGANVITPNKKELSDATKSMPVDSDDDVVTAAQNLIKECGIDAVVATRSKDGMSVVQKNIAPVHLRSANIEVFDVSGAGDTVIATIAASLASGANLAEAAELANIAGSIVVAKVGTAPIRADELKQALENSETGSTAGLPAHKASILSWEESAEQVKRWRARGLKTGFTNGCFDILHAGHVSYLKEARQNCDRLIVGLNRDSSVKILKGKDRPIHDEQSRTVVLSALSSVDMVVLFGAEENEQDNTANELLMTLQPDIYFKGGDYTVDQIPEAPTVKSYGGEISIMPVYEGHSTTASLQKTKTEAA